MCDLQQQILQLTSQQDPTPTPPLAGPAAGDRSPHRATPHRQDSGVGGEEDTPPDTTPNRLMSESKDGDSLDRGGLKLSRSKGDLTMSRWHPFNTEMQLMQVGQALVGSNVIHV